MAQRAKLFMNGRSQCGILHADLDRTGRPLGSLDLLIAAHALAVGAVLVTNDCAFSQISQLPIEDWTVA